MAVIVETGSNVPNANSWVGETDFVAFALARGVTITTEQASKHLIIAADAISILENKMPGERSFDDQTLAFPRDDFYIANRCFDDAAIPNEVKLAQQFAALASFNGIELMPVAQNGKVLIKKKIGPIEKEWAFNKDQGQSPEIPQFDYYIGLLTSLDVGGLTVRRA